MGLDTSFDCWHGAYSTFGDWRRAIAKIANYRIIPIVKFDWYNSEQVDLDYNAFTKKNYMGTWTKPQKDPLMYLLIHSDCEGCIRPKEAKALAPRLSEILLLIPQDATYEWIIDKTEKFIDGLNKAIKENKKVEFH